MRTIWLRLPKAERGVEVRRQGPERCIRVVNGVPQHTGAPRSWEGAEPARGTGHRGMMGRRLLHPVPDPGYGLRFGWTEKGQRQMEGLIADPP